MTDYIPEVMDLLRLNILECPHLSEDHQIGYSVLDWEKTKYDDIIIKSVIKDSEGEAVDSETKIAEYGQFDAIIACEVIYWEQSILPLITILDELFSKQDNNLIFYLIFVERNAMLHKLLKEALDTFKFTYEYLDDPLIKEFEVHTAHLFKIIRK
eukprot:CAMPEP_0205824102 /NCGR_PEP_ID=MMETSP0206-20130828/19440_1 /ASSEMBLY_ACC=CAM_ASM_000279 /TAXON_ID=36767 /ORGANISM="Euplotes focardii, Strain TN1" /LENGTH=154 /DNA_ID=CAMNT_0053121901 /DNA_START=122 /DNA_END=583 /DNA_ORIENTATION=-